MHFYHERKRETSGTRLCLDRRQKGMRMCCTLHFIVVIGEEACKAFFHSHKGERGVGVSGLECHTSRFMVWQSRIGSVKHAKGKPTQLQFVLF